MSNLLQNYMSTSHTIILFEKCRHFFFDVFIADSRHFLHTDRNQNTQTIWLVSFLVRIYWVYIRNNPAQQDGQTNRNGTIRRTNIQYVQSLLGPQNGICVELFPTFEKEGRNLLSNMMHTLLLVYTTRLPTGRLN